MGNKLAIDFGTTNSVAACWDEQDNAPRLLTLPGLSTTAPGTPPLIPSLLVVEDGANEQVILGQTVRDQGLDRHATDRLFRGFKREIVTTQPTPARLIDGVEWTANQAGQVFMRHLLDALPTPAEEIEQLVLTAPVASFRGYLHWLTMTVKGISTTKIRIVDEATAAALGYAVTQPGAVVLVFDFGGGTLDLSLVQLPASKGKVGGLLDQFRFRGAEQSLTARVIAKTGQIIGGSDVDRWIKKLVLARAGLSQTDLDQNEMPLMTACEAAKIALSTQQSATITFNAAGQEHTATLTRDELEQELFANGFYTALRSAVDKLMHTARREGVFKEDIDHVLLVGGTSLMPSVQTTLAEVFKQQGVAAPIHTDKPFTAVAEGALQIAAGLGLDDYLTKSYGLRHLDPATGTVAYDEIIPEGARCPLPDPITVIAASSQRTQTTLELVIGELSTNDYTAVDVQQQNGQVTFIGQADAANVRVKPLNEAAPVVIPLPRPNCQIAATFTVNARRELHVTAVEARSRQQVLPPTFVARLEDEVDPALMFSTNTAYNPIEGVDPAAYFKHLIAEAAESYNNGQMAEAVEPAPPPAPSLTGREPVLHNNLPRGQQRLSRLRLGTLLSRLSPDTITVEAASAMLHSEEFFVRYNAAKAMRQRGDRAARLVLADALKTGSPPTRASAARHLYGFTWAAAQPMLQQALADADRRVREAAIYALCDMRQTSAFQMATYALQNPAEDDEVRDAAAFGLRDCPQVEAVPVLAAALLAQDPAVRTQVMESLSANKTPAARALIRQTVNTDPDPDVQYAAVLSLLEIAEADALPEICDLLMAINGPARIPILRGFFHASNYLHLNLTASPVIGQLLDTLQECLTDPDPDVRKAAVWPLAWLPHDRAVEILVMAFQQESDTGVRDHIQHVAASLMSPAAATIDEYHLGIPG